MASVSLRFFPDELCGCPYRSPGMQGGQGRRTLLLFCPDAEEAPVLDPNLTNLSMLPCAQSFLVVNGINDLQAGRHRVGNWE